MRSSSDGALGKKVGMSLEPAFLQLVGTKLMGARGTSRGVEVPDLPNARQEQQKQEQQTQWEYDDLVNSPVIAAAPTFALSSTLKVQSVSPDSGSRGTSDTQGGTATTDGYSIPAVSQMFIQAVQNLHTPRRAGDKISARVEPQMPWHPSMQGISSIQTSRPNVVAAKASQSADVNPCETPEMAPKKNSTLEFGKKYSTLRVKVKRSFRKRGTDASRRGEERPPRHEDPNSIEAKLRRLEAPRALAVRPRGTEKKQPSQPQIQQEALPSPPQLPKVDLSSITTPEIAPASAPEPVQPPSKVAKSDSPLARVRPTPAYKESVINAFWCLWFVGFLFPPLWVGGSTGIFSSTRCGFMAGMANIMSLLVAIIVVVIFFI